MSGGVDDGKWLAILIPGLALIAYSFAALDSYREFQLEMARIAAGCVAPTTTEAER